jgi:hypothetical protein
MLWCPRALQGEGRHDNPDLYGCLYASADPEGAIVESLAAFRGSGRLRPSMLRRHDRVLRLGKLALSDRAAIVDLDDPHVLVRARLRPSRVATRRRPVTREDAARLHRDHPEAAALRWWSTIESSLLHLTVFDRGLAALDLLESRELRVGDAEVLAAAEIAGLV